MNMNKLNSAGKKLVMPEDMKHRLAASLSEKDCIPEESVQEEVPVVRHSNRWMVTAASIVLLAGVSVSGIMLMKQKGFAPEQGVIIGSYEGDYEAPSGISECFPAGSADSSAELPKTPVFDLNGDAVYYMDGGLIEKVFLSMENCGEATRLLGSGDWYKLNYAAEPDGEYFWIEVENGGETTVYSFWFSGMYASVRESDGTETFYGCTEPEKAAENIGYFRELIRSIPEKSDTIMLRWCLVNTADSEPMELSAYTLENMTNFLSSLDMTEIPYTDSGKLPNIENPEIAEKYGIVPCLDAEYAGRFVHLENMDSGTWQEMFFTSSGIMFTIYHNCRDSSCRWLENGEISGQCDVQAFGFDFQSFKGAFPELLESTNPDIVMNINSLIDREAAATNNPEFAEYRAFLETQFDQIPPLYPVTEWDSLGEDTVAEIREFLSDNTGEALSYDTEEVWAITDYARTFDGFAPLPMAIPSKDRDRPYLIFQSERTDSSRMLCILPSGYLLYGENFNDGSASDTLYNYFRFDYDAFVQAFPYCLEFGKYPENAYDSAVSDMKTNFPTIAERLY